MFAPDQCDCANTGWEILRLTLDQLVKVRIKKEDSNDDGEETSEG
jgi:hypothetical protein